MYLFFLPWLMFALIMMLFTYGNYHAPFVVWTAVIVCAAFACIFTVIGSEAQRHYTFLGVLCALAVACGTLGGMVNYSWNMEPYWFYDEAREYANVLPSEPAAAHGDAGKIVFAKSAVIDTTKAVGYKMGHVYCVAPIMDAGSGARVEYWAVGIDCCAERANFACDDAKSEGGAVNGGLVVQDRGLFRESPFDQYAKAVRTAEAAYDLTSASEPLYVRWVKDPDALQSKFYWDGTGNMFLTILLYGAVNAGLAFAFMFGSPKGR